MELKEPRRKRRWAGLETSQQSLPIPLESRTGIPCANSTWHTFTGKYNGDCVVIADRDEMTRISSQGCFGKGCRSRNFPDFYKITRGVPPFIRERQWQQRRTWAGWTKPSSDIHSIASNEPNLETSYDNPTYNPESQVEVVAEGHDVVVLNDSDSDCDESTYLPDLNPRMETEPFFIGETLHLSLEEAFFLSYALGCLNVVDLNGLNLSLLKMWRLFIESQDDFIETYLIYHYFRSKGWIVKPGLKFGGDFVLYKQGPSFYHASYIVKVSMAGRTGLKRSDQSNPLLGWTRLLGLNRLAETAAKELLLCQVVKPKDISEDELRSPRVLSKFTVQEVLVQRWVSSQERDKDMEEI